MEAEETGQLDEWALRQSDGREGQHSHAGLFQRGWEKKQIGRVPIHLQDLSFIILILKYWRHEIAIETGIEIAIEIVIEFFSK